MGEFYTSKSRKNVKQFDRYKKCKILNDLETQDTLLETRDVDVVITTLRDSYHTVQSNEECRLDIISYNYYGNPLLWWVLAQANDIYDPLVKPKAGDILRIPDLVSMYGDKGILS